MKIRHFTKTNFLREIGSSLLRKLLDKFSPQLSANNITLPSGSTTEAAFYETVSSLAKSPDGLPSELIEAMHAIEGMANEPGQERLETAIVQEHLPLAITDKSTRAEIAVQVFLEAPDVFTAKLNELRLTRLASFEYHGCKNPQDRRQTFTAPDAATLARITTDMEEWFVKSNRGKQNTHIEPCVIEGEYWFIVRHGDTYARITKLENGKPKVEHFRPAKDDVIVYSPERDDIRIHAGTKGERELYRETFGMRLFGDNYYFSERKAYTLEPLRALGKAALDTDGLDGIESIILREVEVAWNNPLKDSLVRKSGDIFQSEEGAQGKWKAIPDTCKIVKAVFDVKFEGAGPPRKVELRPPNVLKIGRHCDAALVHHWLTKNKFRDTAAAASAIAPFQPFSPEHIQRATNVQPIAIA